MSDPLPSEPISQGDSTSPAATQPLAQSRLPPALAQPAAVPSYTPRPVERTGTGGAQQSSLEQPAASSDRRAPSVAVQFDASLPSDSPDAPAEGARRLEQPAVLKVLHAELRHSGLPVQRLDDGSLRLSLRREIPFRFDSAEVPERSRQVLDTLVRLMGRYRQWTLTVIGHTDSTGPDHYNLALSLERARSVADYLVRKGLPADQVFSEGKGESEPMSAVRGAMGYRKWLDRRIEMVIRSTQPSPGRGTAMSPRQPPPSPGD